MAVIVIVKSKIKRYPKAMRRAPAYLQTLLHIRVFVRSISSEGPSRLPRRPDSGGIAAGRATYMSPEVVDVCCLWSFSFSDGIQEVGFSNGNTSKTPRNTKSRSHFPSSIIRHYMRVTKYTVNSLECANTRCRTSITPLLWVDVI